MHSRVTVLLVAVLAAVYSIAHAAVQPNQLKHPPIDIQAVQQGIDKSRKEVQIALDDPAAAFEAYLSKFAAVAVPRGHPIPGGPHDSKSKVERFEIFKSNLHKASERNSASRMLAYGVTPFMHLAQEEYEMNYLGQQQQPKGSTTDSTSTEMADFLQYTWAADEDAFLSRKLLSRTQAQTEAPGGGDVDLPDPTAAGHAMPPAEQLPGHGHDDSTRAPASGLPTLPFNPEPGAAGCSAQRPYPYSSLVPPVGGVNWVAAGGTTPVKDQGLCGSCVAFATTSLAEFMHMRKYGSDNMTTDLSEQDLLDCTLGDGCKGQYQTAYVDLIGCIGVALEADGPYRVADGGANCKPTNRFSGMAHGQGGGWAFVSGNSDSLAQAVSTAPVMVTLDATDWALYAGGVLDCDQPGNSSNHAVVVVGYINGVQQPNGEVWDMFLVRNSFGSWWGGGNGPYAGHIFLRKGCTLGPAAMYAFDGVVPLHG